MEQQNVIVVSVLHGERTIYEKLQQIIETISRRIKRNLPVNVATLAASKCVGNLMTMNRRYMIQCGQEIWWGGDYEDEARLELARYIIDSAEDQL